MKRIIILFIVPLMLSSCNVPFAESGLTAADTLLNVIETEDITLTTSHEIKSATTASIEIELTIEEAECVLDNTITDDFTVKVTEVSLTIDSILAVADESKADKNKTESILYQIIDEGGGYSEEEEFFKEFFEYGYIIQYGETYYLYIGANRRGETYSTGIRVVNLTNPEDNFIILRHGRKMHYFIPDNDGGGVLMASGKPRELYFGVYKDSERQMPVIYGTNTRWQTRMDMIFDIEKFEYFYINYLFGDENNSPDDFINSLEAMEQDLFLKI